MACCYIIFSEKLNRYYVGFTTEAISDRLQKHNSAQYGNHRFTAKADDWKIYLVIECTSSRQALAIEKHIKRMKSRVYIESLKSSFDLTEELKSKYKN